MPFSYVSYYDYHKPCYKLMVNEVLDSINDTPKNKNYILKYSNLNEIAIELRYNQFEMYDEMMEKYFESHNPLDIKFLIFTGRDYFTNNAMSVPYYLIGKYGLKNASLIALNQGCSGTPQGMNIARHIIKSDPEAKVMLVSLSKMGSIEERYVWPTINGDGAGMMVMESEGFLKIVDITSCSDGMVSFERCNKNRTDHEEDVLKRENLNMFNVKKVILELLEHNNLSTDDINIFIPQNLNHLLCRMYAKGINVKPDKVFLENIPYGGHLGDVDSTRNLKDAVSRYNEKTGTRFLLFTLGEVGQNYTYNSVLLESC
ncbi:MAG TPA: 3-oxoacyl-[acyl-carrier-protein] synthase III C-terminal domain-containing protein [Clostridia bacterium]